MKSKRQRSAKDLRLALHARTEALASRAAKSDPQEIKKGVEELERLETLLRLLERPGSMLRRRIFFGAGVVLTIGLASWLLFDRVGSTVVRGEVDLAEASFTLNQERMVVDGTPVAALALSGLTSNPSSIALDTREGAGPRLAALRLGPVRLGEGSRLTLSVAVPSNAARLAVHGPATVLSATVRTPTVEPSSGSAEDVPVRYEFDTGADREFIIDLTPQLGAPFDLAPQLRVDNLSFSRVREEGRPGEQPFAVSTVLGGNLWLEEIEVERPLRPGDPLTMRSAEGEMLLRSLRFADGHWKLTFDGRVQDLETNFLDTRRSLMPTRGQWLQAQRGIWLFWGAAIYAVGLIYGVLRWFSIDL